MRSIKGGAAVSLGIPFAVAFLLVQAALPIVGASFEGFLFLASFLWFLTAAAILAPAAVRVSLGRRWGRWPLDHDRAWRRRQRRANLEGLKVAIALLVAFGLLVWTELSFVSNTPGRHDVRIVLPAPAGPLTVRVPQPRAADCPEWGMIDLSYSGPSPRVMVGDAVVKATAVDHRRSSYRVPIRSERSTYSCYFDFPKVFSAGGSVPVHLYVASQGSASDSTPVPTRYLDGSWGWHCRAVPQGTGCAVLAVVNDDPASEASSLALLVAGAAFAIVVSLLVSVAIAMWRGWIDDVGGVWRLVRRRTEDFLAEPPPG
jgi:hypothetical protein